ncbi:hypothetical protein B0A50_02179 [Salinomyces thailandicus]|uniref:Uncharacterized protein n=1 Tax=Salinomyces thailandicus TaxID=706561 RepID=A0A4U0U8B9_9PEZI|nr:hypothetical protein B0A50_02179 [Salinomyces thailandica]
MGSPDNEGGRIVAFRPPSRDALELAEAARGDEGVPGVVGAADTQCDVGEDGTGEVMVLARLWYWRGYGTGEVMF